MTISEAVCRAVFNVREEMGVSQRQLAARVALKTPMPRTYISKIENGHAVPGIENIHALSLALGITAHELVQIAENMMDSQAKLPEKRLRVTPQKPKKYTTRLPQDTLVKDPAAIARRRELAKKLGTIPMEVVR